MEMGGKAFSLLFLFFRSLTDAEGQRQIRSIPLSLSLPLAPTSRLFPVTFAKEGGKSR